MSRTWPWAACRTKRSKIWSLNRSRSEEVDAAGQNITESNCRRSLGLKGTPTANSFSLFALLLTRLADCLQVLPSTGGMRGLKGSRISRPVSILGAPVPKRRGSNASSRKRASHKSSNFNWFWARLNLDYLSSTSAGGRRESQPASMDLAEAMIIGVDTSISRTLYTVNSWRQARKQGRVVLDKKAMRCNK